MTLIVGFVILFVLGEAGIGQASSIPPEIEIAVGVLALLVAALVGSGLAGRLRDWWQSRQSKDQQGMDADGPSNTDALRGIERLPGYERMPRRVQVALESESPWIAWIAGVGVGMPNAYLLAAIAAILSSGVGTSVQVGALIAFSFLAMAQAVIPLVSFLAAPEATRAGLDRLYAWLHAHHRLIVTSLATVAGLYLLIKGISSL
jgi:Sap, sulfolipid-1-addressing protein